MVDWVRSSYQSTWVVNPNNPQRVGGVFVFVPDDTPAYPFPHWYGSRHWLKKEEFEVNGLGDQGPDFGCQSAWSAGAGLPQIPAAILLGENCLEPKKRKPMRRVCEFTKPIPETLTVTFGFALYRKILRATLVSLVPVRWKIAGMGFNLVDANGGNPDGLINIGSHPDEIFLDCDDQMNASFSINGPPSFVFPGDYTRNLKFVRPLLWIQQLSLGVGTVMTPGGPITNSVWVTASGDEFE